MLQLLPQNEILNIATTVPEQAVGDINLYIERNSCENMSVDISGLNLIDACYVSTLCSTQHYIKYPNGKISWKVSSRLVGEFNSNLALGNAEYFN
ncbi:hypothetical protein IJD34_05925 [bacterium]|nr:hypothetical protein [bacterium]